MLASRFSRMRETPVRYAAMDPAHAQAIRNYLAIAGRAYGLPGASGRLLGQPQGYYQRQLGRQLPAAQEMLQGLWSDHDPAHLAAFFDLLDEHGISPTPRGEGRSGTLDTLADLFDDVHSHDQGRAHPAVLRGYGGEAMRHPDMFRTLLLAHSQGTPPIGTALPDLLRVLTRHQNYDPLRNAYSASRDYLSPMHLVEMHDALDAVSSSGAGHLKQNAQNAVGGALRDVVHPALWHYGEHGEFPQ